MPQHHQRISFSTPIPPALVQVSMSFSLFIAIDRYTNNHPRTAASFNDETCSV